MRVLDLAVPTADASAETPVSLASVAPAGDLESRDTHAIGEAIASLAAGVHAATYQLLVLLREFDARSGWNNGFLSCAHWLHWRTGIDLGACREKVRVARALASLPRISWHMEHGHLSFAKVRALTRVATQANETSLMGVALKGTAAHVERFVRAWRRVDRASEAREEEQRYLKRSLSVWVDDDGMVVVRGRLTPEVGAVLQRALEAAGDRLFRDGRDEPAARSVADEVTPAQRRADALELLAESALSADLDRGTAGDRYQVVMHMSAETGVGGVGSVDHIKSIGGEGHASSGTDGGGIGDDSVLELDHGAQHVSAEMSRRLTCDASVVTMCDVVGVVADAGRRTRTIPAAIRRALAARDRQCRFPGCASRRCDAHHVEHWVDGGATRLDNLVLLCRRHHRAVHEGGWEVEVDTDGKVTVYRPSGEALEACPPAPESPTPVSASPMGPPPVWDGTRFNLTWAIDVLWRRDVTAGLGP